MERITAETDTSKSATVVSENVERLAAMFPEALVDGKVDLDVLRQLLGDDVEESDERYGLTWHGKRQALQLAQTPSTGTLRPCPEDSEEWDTTKNLMIEGDNLEVLKLLQKSYAGKIKLIYIDPPYNTGKDFVYKDNYRDNIANYLEQTGQVDEEGNKSSTNTEASGRFHTDWLNMMYPRLKLARELLRDDGVLFVSIGEQEASRLQVLLENVFGEAGNLGRFVWTYGLSANQGAISANHEYVLAFTRGDGAGTRFMLTSADLDRLGPEVSDACFRAEQEKNPVSQLLVPKGVRSERAEDFTIPAGPTKFGKAEVIFRDDAVFSDGLLQDPVRLEAAWTMKEICESWFSNLESGAASTPVLDSKGQEVVEIYFAASGRLSYRKERTEQSKVNSHISGDELTYSRGRLCLEDLFSGEALFTYPKPTALIERLAGLGTKDDDIVLDFFAGSGTTGHAVMAQNAEDGGSRRFILVQLPEPLDPEVKEQKAAAEFCDEIDRPRNLAELTKERLRRAAAKISEEHPDYDGDLGFRAFKLDSSNIREWDENPEDLEESLLAAENHVKEDRTDEDLLYELLLKQGIDLSEPIENKEIAGHNVQSIGAGTLITCLDQTITQEDTQALGEGISRWHKELDPAGETTCIFRDSAFPNDVAKTNLTETLNQNHINTIRSI